MRIPLPTVPVSTQKSQGQFSAPTVAPIQDATAQTIQQFGQSLMSAGANASRIGADLQADLDQGFLMESDAIASEVTRGVVGKYRQLAGLPAIEQFEDMHEGLRTQLRNLGDTARSPEQRQRLERILAQRMQDASDSMAAHRDGEVRSRAIGGASAGVAAAVEDYRAALGNPEDMQLARSLAIQRQQELSRLKGEDGDMARLAMLETTTKLHVGAINSLLAAGGASEARAYLEKHGGEIAQDAKAQASKVVKVAGVADKAQRLVDEMAGRGMSYADQIQSIDGLFQNGTLNVEERDEAEQRATRADTMTRRAQAAEAADVLTAGEQFLASGKPLTDDPQLYSRAEKAGVLPQLLQFEKSRRLDTDPYALAESMSLPDEALATVSRAEIVQRYWGKLGKSDLETVLARRDRAAGESRSSGGGANVLSVDDRVTSSFLKLKGLPDDGKIPQGVAVEFQTFRRNAQEQIEAEREAGGKVSPQRLQEILDAAGRDLVYKAQPSWYWPDPLVPRLLLNPDEVVTAGVEATGSGEWVPLSAIDAGVRAEIVRRLSADLLPVTEQTVADEWVKFRKPKNMREFMERAKK